MRRADPGVTRYSVYWYGHGEVTAHGVGQLFFWLRRGYPWVHRVNGDVRAILRPVRRLQ